MNTRDAKLRGVRAATEVHEALGINRLIKEGLEYVDVFASIAELEIPVLCRPLDGLLGAYCATESGRGILVTTNRRLPVQRFTAAHELGHAWLEHGESLDSEDSIIRARSNPKSVASEEVEAESFASEFLLPRTLIFYTAKRQGWSKRALAEPSTVYQLSLRTCTSYEATWRALLDHGIVDSKAAEQLRSSTPKAAKVSVLNGVSAENSWADALKIRIEDHGSRILASPDDTVALSLPEKSSSGYRWSGLENFPEIELVEEKTSACALEIGSLVHREVYFRGKGRQKISLEHRRPWESHKRAIDEFEIEIDFNGQEFGLPRAVR